MDTKTPPIPLKHHHQEKKQVKKVVEKGEVSLPPLTPLPNGSAPSKSKNSGVPWTRGPPQVGRSQDHLKKRPYRVLHIGATPLMHACQQGDKSRVQRLLKEQSETIGYRDRTLRNALHYCMDAATGGAVAATAPELINAADAEGHTPLHLAVIAGDTQLVAVLLANGADVNAKDMEDHSVLHWATVCGEAECVRLVLAAGARPSTPDLRGGSPLHYAAQCCGAAVTAELSVPKKVGLKVLQTLLEFGADVNAKDEDGRQPILWAASAGSVEAVLALARTGGSAAAGATDKDGLTALHCAASRGHARCVEALVNLCGAQPDHVDDNGCSALHYAATLGHADATALLLRLGADPNRQDRKGRTPALCAAAKGQLETLKILAQHGGSLHARTVRGTGVAHEAVLSGRIELIEWLARKKPSTLDVSTHDGRTPLHVAALHGYLDACKVLLDYGGRINAIFRTSKSGPMTPLDAALYRGHRDCAKLIQMHGGTTAHHLRTFRTAPTRAFAAKLRVKQRVSSSGSESSIECRVRRQPDIYIEEHWIEKRTRRRASPCRHEDRRGSRSFSEEEVRLSKSSRKNRQRRARSESARYENFSSGERREKKPCRNRRKYSKHEYGESSSDIDDISDELEEKTRARRKSLREDERSLSDDSLEVVVVRRSLEKKLEKVEYSEKKSKTPREMTETRVSETKRKSSRRKSRTAKRADSSVDAEAGEAKIPTSRESLSEESAEKTDILEKKGRRREKSQREFRENVTDSSQETVERVTVTAMVHKDQPPDTPKASEVPIVKSEAMIDENLGKTDVDDILEKADEIQNVLMAKAADLKKDVSEIRRQITEESVLEVTKQDDAAQGRTQRTSESDETAEDSQMEISRLQSQRGSESSDSAKREKSEDEAVQSKTPENPQQEEKTEDNVVDEKEEDSTLDIQIKSSEKSGKESGKEDATSAEVSDSDKESRSHIDQVGSKSSTARSTPTLKSKSEESAEVKEKKVPSDKEKSEDNKQEPDSTGKEPTRDESNVQKTSGPTEKPERGPAMMGTEDIRHIDSSSSSAKSSKRAPTSSRPTTGKGKRSDGASSRPPSKHSLFESSGERSPGQSAIVAVIESPEWDEEDEEVAKEIRDVVGDGADAESDPEDDDSLGVLRVLPSTSEEETPRRPQRILRPSKRDTLPYLERKVIVSPRGLRPRTKQRRDSGGRDSGIEPSPRVSKIPKRTLKCCPNSEKHQALNIDTVTRDVQISLRRYHLERKIFFQLMELKRLQIRHGRANEQVLVKRQVDVFHKAGLSGPALGVARYEKPYTFRDFEAFLYEQLRKLQRRPPTPDWCTEAKQCTQKTHRCHHATSAYTSVPIYTYLGGGDEERDESTHLPRIESRGRGQMTVEVTRGEEKQIIALPAERLDRTKRYFVTFTVRGDGQQESDTIKTSRNAQRNTKSV